MKMIYTIAHAKIKLQLKSLYSNKILVVLLLIGFSSFLIRYHYDSRTWNLLVAFTILEISHSEPSTC